MQVELGLNLSGQRDGRGPAGPQGVGGGRGVGHLHPII
jgi:hypothetical protein